MKHEGVMSPGVQPQSFFSGRMVTRCLASIFQLRRAYLALLMGLAILCTAQIPAWSAGVTDIIWLESNSTAGNSILAFRNDGSGNPTFLGSTPAGGTGVFDKTFALGPFDSDQNLIVNDDGTLLFAVNSGSNSIAVFRITPKGLVAVELTDGETLVRGRPGTGVTGFV